MGMRFTIVFLIGFFMGRTSSVPPDLSAFTSSLSDGGSVCPPCPNRNATRQEAPGAAQPALLPAEPIAPEARSVAVEPIEEQARTVAVEPIIHRGRSVTCDATPCNGFFQYVGPNRAPNATEILRAENRTYTISPTIKIFFPKSTTPAECVREWRSNKEEWATNGMSAWGEDLAIFDAFFPDPDAKGIYLEIGGHDGVRESKSRLFDACLGWEGLLVEPVIRNYRRMAKLRPNAHNLGMAPSCVSPGVAMFPDSHFTNSVANAEGATLAIHCGPLSGPLEQLGIRRVDFWSLDVEGSELAILKTVDFDAVRIDVIMAESENRLADKQNMAEEVRTFLRGKGYVMMNDSVKVSKSDVFLHRSACPRYDFPECK